MFSYTTPGTLSFHYVGILAWENTFPITRIRSLGLMFHLQYSSGSVIIRWMGYMWYILWMHSWRETFQRSLFKCAPETESCHNMNQQHQLLKHIGKWQLHNIAYNIVCVGNILGYHFTTLRPTREPGGHARDRTKNQVKIYSHFFPNLIFNTFPRQD